MSAGRNLVKSLILISTLVVTASLAASAPAWQIDPLGSPSSYSTIATNGNTTQYVKITHRDTGEPITKEYLQEYEGRAEWFYLENGTRQASGDLKYQGNGVWYAHQKVGKKDGKFRFEAQRGTPIDEEANATKSITVSNISVEILTDMSEPYLPGREDARIEVNVTNATSGSFISNANLKVKITNTTYLSTQTFPNDPEGMKYRLYSLIIPDAVEQKYSLHVVADYDGKTAVTTTFIRTRDYLNTSVSKVRTEEGCNQQSTPTSCEPGAVLDLGLNVTAAYANNVTLEVMKDAIGGGLTQISRNLLSKSQSTGLYQGTVTYPEIDISSYKGELILKFIAKNNYSTYTNYYNISKATFELSPDMADTAYQGSEYDIKFSMLTPYTEVPYSESKFASATLNVMYPNGSTYTTIEKSDLSYDNSTGWVTGDLVIPQGTPNGTYTIEAYISNSYGTTKTFTHTFDLKKTSRIFSATDQINQSIINKGNYTRNFTITNKLSSSITVNPVAKGGIENITTVSGGQDISIGPENSTNVTVKFQVDDIKDYSGQIILKDVSSDYSETIDINLNSPDCEIRNGTICVDREWINITLLGPKQVTEKFSIYNLGTGDVDVKLEKKGSTAGYMSISDKDFNFSTSRQIEVNYTIKTPVNVTGEIFINTTASDIALPTKLVGDFKEPEVDFNIVKDSVDLGLIQDLSTSMTIEAKNNGSTTINYIESSQVNITDYQAISPGSTGSITATINRSEFGMMETSISMTAYRADPSTSDKSLPGSTDSIQVVARFMPETQAAKQNITSWAQRLKGQAFNTGIINKLAQAEQNATKLEDALSKGNGVKAFNIYQATLNNLESLESQINSNSQGGQNSDQDTDQQQGSSDDSQGGPNSGTPPGGTKKKSGGMGILPIILVVLILVVGGFIFYTSYIPEPGDPLYEYLGEQQ